MSLVRITRVVMLTQQETLAELQYPNAADDSLCAGNTLFSNWDTANLNFGNNLKLPELIVDGAIYPEGDRDDASDGA